MTLLAGCLGTGNASAPSAAYRTIMAGGETASPPDFPSNRLDPLGVTSPFNVVGALEISSGGWDYKGSGTALSPNWVLTAAHNLDTNDDGAPDAGLAINFHLPGFGIYTATAFYTHPDFGGFANASIQRDLGLLYFDTPLPSDLFFPSLSYDLHIGDQVALVGYGRSGYGSYGYTTDADLTDRRIGYNVVDWFTLDDQGEGFNAIFGYDFDSPDTFGEPGGSLGNDLESLIGPGDSGGPVFVELGAGYALAGVSTFTEGYGGRFGDTGGGIVLNPCLDWIGQTTGMIVPEPEIKWFLLAGLLSILTCHFRKSSSRGA